MNEDMLRSWVRGELGAEDRLAVSRWLVRCTDPRVGDLLHGLIREAQESPLDRALTAAGAAWAALVSAWDGLLDAGQAVWSDGVSPAIVVAAAAEAPAAPPMEVEASEAGLDVRLVGRPGEAWLLFLTTDAPAAWLVGDGVFDASGAWRGLITAPAAARFTLWAVSGPPALRSVGATLTPADRLVALVGAPGATKHAWRHTPSATA